MINIFSSFPDDFLIIIMCVCHSNDGRLDDERGEKTIRKTATKKESS